ncbi:MAG: glycoside hydrolase family 78 protein, partial [Tannerella sp.]|nr:glycoside hydrolase family 78 protein [Tannerella sp.]
MTVFLSCTGKSPNTYISSVQCRNLENPVCVDKATFGWQIKSDAQNVIQTAWEIEVASSRKALEKGKADVWSSGEKEGEAQLGIEPENSAFYPGHLYWWRVRIRDGERKMTPWSKPACFSVGPGPAKENWKARWITAEWEDNMPMPYFRKTFHAGNRIERAVAYLSGLGCSDLFINGARIDSTRILDPAQTNYEQYALYSAFDVTQQLRKGDNCIGIMIGNGWYNQDIVWGKGFGYGKPIVLMQLEIMYENGTKETIATDDSWQWATGPVTGTNIYAGETYDANREIKNWSEASSDCSSWKKAVMASGENIPKELYPQLMPPIRLQKVIEAVDMWQDREGNWIFDFGVNVAGVPVLTVRQPGGTHLKMRMGELLNDDRSINYATTGVFATNVVQTDGYICSGEGTERWTPRFTYHGYRYLELSGAATKPELSWIGTAPVHNDVKRQGSFECSDGQINRLHEMAIRTMLGNTHGIPTDCPHRERCGWLGDAHAVAPFENLNFDLNLFWMKYLADIHSSSSVFLENTLHQKLHNNEFYFADKQPGIPFMISPGKRLCGVASPDWGTAVVQLPWYVYLYYGNKEALELYYDEMKQWVEHIQALTENDIVPYGLGDWCPPGGNKEIDCPIPLSSSVFHYLDAETVAKAADVLNKKEDAATYEALANRLKKAFIREFYDSENNTFGSQTANAMALAYGLFPENSGNAISDATAGEIKKHHDFIHTGIFGLGRIGQALSRYGNDKTAFEVFTKTGEYSFAYMWEHAGATTLWEILPVSEASEKVCVEGASSLNHPMQGVYDAWFYEDIAGIRPEKAGYKVIRFEPTMTRRLSWAKGTIETPYGPASSDWKKENGSLYWTVTIPPNTSGQVIIP